MLLSDFSQINNNIVKLTMTLLHKTYLYYEFLTFFFSEYVKAAKKLEQIGSPAKLAKIDCTVEKALATKYGVKGYPTLKFFKNGKPVDYAGPREAAVSR